MTADDQPPPVAQRLTIGLIPKAARELAELVVETGLSKSNVINRAISIYRFVQAELAAGRELAVHDPKTGTAQVVHIL